MASPRMKDDQTARPREAEKFATFWCDQHNSDYSVSSNFFFHRHTTQVQHTKDVFQLSGFTNDNKRNLSKQ